MSQSSAFSFSPDETAYVSQRDSKRRVYRNGGAHCLQFLYSKRPWRVSLFLLAAKVDRYFQRPSLKANAASLVT